jgi:prepilin-type N-terminal cleavage/methylation domain-containing protein
MHTSSRSGLTLIEVLITVALIVILTGVYFLAANPGGQLASTRNSRRKTDLQNLKLAIATNIGDQGNEQFGCAAGAIPTTTKIMASATGTGYYDIAPCLVPTYLSALPFDPVASSAYYASPTDYNTGYGIMENGSGTIILSAPNAELGKTITVIE